MDRFYRHPAFKKLSISLVETRVLYEVVSTFGWTAQSYDLDELYEIFEVRSLEMKKIIHIEGYRPILVEKFQNILDDCMKHYSCHPGEHSRWPGYLKIADYIVTKLEEQ